MRRTTLLVSVVAWAGALSPVQGAEIELLETGDSTKLIIVQGPIEAGDGHRFTSVAEDTDRALVILRSSGGSVPEALEMGAEIKYRGYATYVPPNFRCMSACALIWISGERRRMSDGAVIGFHAAYTRDGRGQRSETGMANAEIGSFLSHLGLPIDAIRFITAAGPSDFKILTPKIAQEIGIDIIVNNGDEDVFLISAHTLARRAADFVGLDIACAELFGLEDGWFKGRAAETIKSGHEIVGGAKFGELLSIVLEEVKGNSQFQDRNFAWCASTAWYLTAEQSDPFPSGPSYECGGVINPTERAICNDDQISAADRVIAAMYFYHRQSAEPELAEWVRSSQRDWLTRRNECGGTRDCIMQAYSQRFEALLP